MKLGRILILLGLLLVAFAVLKESREPYLWLFVDDLLHPKPSPYLTSLSDGMAARLYADTRPHIGKVARLQKGVVLLRDGRDLVEEGFGFGLPLVEISGQAYLSRSASVEQAGNTWVKRYEMDTLDTPSGFLRRKYEPVPVIGTVTVSYTLSADGIDVVVDLAGLEIAWDRVYVMNEQGARTFTRYEEPGLAVQGRQLGRWQPTIARQGCIVADDHSLRFCVETQQAGSRYYGRERYNQYYPIGVYVLSWAGIDLELEYPVCLFSYRILLERSGVE